MKTEIAAGEFKAKCLHLLDEVCRSQTEIVITKRGRVVARLVPPEEETPALFGRMKGSAKICGDLVEAIGEAGDADE